MVELLEPAIAGVGSPAVVGLLVDLADHHLGGCDRLVVLDSGRRSLASWSPSFPMPAPAAASR